MCSKLNTFKSKEMTLTERKAESMRQLKASFNRAISEGTLRTKEASHG